MAGYHPNRGALPPAPGPAGHLLLGNMLDLRRDMLGVFLASHRRYGDVVRFRLGPTVAHGLFHPDLAERVLIHDLETFGKLSQKHGRREGVVLMLGNGLVSSDGDDGGGRHRCAYMPFGSGPRVCIGNHFAMTESQLLLAQTAQHFELRPVAGQSVNPELAVTYRPQGGLKLALFPLDHNARASSPCLENPASG